MATADTHLQEATDALHKSIWKTEDGEHEIEIEGGLEFHILKAICKKTLFSPDVWAGVVDPWLQEGHVWFVIDGDSLIEAAVSTAWRVDGVGGKITGLLANFDLLSDDGQRYTLTAYLASIKVCIVEFRDLVRSQRLVRGL